MRPAYHTHVVIVINKYGYAEREHWCGLVQGGQLLQQFSNGTTARLFRLEEVSPVPKRRNIRAYGKKLMIQKVVGFKTSDGQTVSSIMEAQRHELEKLLNSKTGMTAVEAILSEPGLVVEILKAKVTRAKRKSNGVPRKRKSRQPVPSYLDQTGRGEPTAVAPESESPAA